MSERLTITEADLLLRKFVAIVSEIHTANGSFDGFIETRNKILRAMVGLEEVE